MELMLMLYISLVVSHGRWSILEKQMLLIILLL